MSKPDEATRLRRQMHEQRVTLRSQTKQIERLQTANTELRRALKPFAEFEQTLREWRWGDGHGGTIPMQAPWPRHRPVLHRDRPHETDRDRLRFFELHVEDFETAAKLLGLKP